MAVMCFLGIAIAYVMRVCLSVAITEMVAKVNQTNGVHEDHSICPSDPLSQSSNSTTILVIDLLLFLKNPIGFINVFFYI